MNDHAIDREYSAQETAGLWSQLFVGAIGIVIVLAGLPAQASESQTPWECSSYTGDARTRCVEAFAESQRDQIAALQEKLQAQQETVNRLQDQLERRAATNAELQRQLAQPPAVAQMVPRLYTYPPMGLSFSLGSPWIYGTPFYYPPFPFGPLGHGPRYWGHPW